MNAAQQFKIMGFEIVAITEKNTNGPDMWVKRKNRVYTVEIKKAKRMPRGTYQSQPVEKNRLNDDLIAIEFPSGYVLIESMKDHLKNCSAKGYRGLGVLT